MLQTKIALLPIALFALIIIILAFSFSNAELAYAHITKKFGNITLEVGWSNEPALVGELNNAIVQVNQTSGGKNNSTAVINALADMNIVVKYGGTTKPLDFEPSEETEGLYNGKMIPTRIGSYNLAMNGTIQGQKINAEIPLDLVEGKQKISFPDATSSSAIEGGGGNITTANNNIGPRLQSIVSQLANDIDSAKGGIDTIAKSNADTQKSIQNLKGAADRSYMIGMGGIGAGVAGIIIAAVALSRKKEVLSAS
ncbi:MAG: hypothetical protein WA421_13605 [Nitrososphaeraceae archaeon]